jgi:hypothetical protein
MPDLGIGEALAAFGGGDLLSLLGIGGGEAAAGAGAGAAGAGATGLADIVGTGTGLAGGTTGLEGTLLAGGATGGIDAAAGAGGATALGTATDFLGAPGASGFNPGAVASGASAFEPTALGGVTSSSLPSGVANANAFDTSGAGIPGLSSGTPSTAPGVIPGSGGASSIAAPAGVNAPVDATSFAGNSSVGGAPLSGQAGVTPGGAAPSSSISDLLGKAGGGVMDSITKNPLGIALGAAGLGYNVLQGQKNTRNQDALTADANVATKNSNEMIQSGEALQQYLTNGTLPPAFQSQVDQAIQDAKTSAISNAAQQGQNTDPTQNTSLAASLAKIDAQRPNMQAQVASQLFSSGSSLVSAGGAAAGLSGQLFQSLVANDTTQAANTGKAIATLAAALSGKASNTIGGTNISVSAA